MRLFDFVLDIDTYAQRKIDRYEGKDGLMVDTCAVSDSNKPYETAVKHSAYDDGKWIIVELYATKQEAEKGHNKWVKRMTTGKLPEILRDVSTAGVTFLCDALGKNKNWRIHIKAEGGK